MSFSHQSVRSDSGDDTFSSQPPQKRRRTNPRKIVLEDSEDDVSDLESKTEEPTVRFPGLKFMKHVDSEPEQDRSFQVAGISVPDSDQSRNIAIQIDLRDDRSGTKAVIHDIIVKNTVAPTTQKQLLFANTLCKLFNRLPTPIPPRLDHGQGCRPLKTQLKLRALAMAFPEYTWDSKLHIDRFSGRVSPSAVTKTMLQVPLHYFNVDTGEYEQYTHNLKFCDVRMDIDIPTSQNVVLFEIADPKEPTNLKPAEKPRFQKAVTLARYVQLELHGAICRITDLKNAIQKLFSLYGVEQRRRYHYTDPTGKQIPTTGADGSEGRPGSKKSPQIQKKITGTGNPKQENTRQHISTIRRELLNEWQLPPALVDSSIDQLKSKLESLRNEVDGSWLDAYGPNQRMQSAQNGSKDPFAVSLDAVWPYYVDSDYTAYHHHENVVVTAQYRNYMKIQFLPAVLGLISEALRNGSETSSPERMEILHRFDHLYVVGCQTPYKRRQRIASAVSEVEFKDQVAKWTLPLASDLDQQASHLWMYEHAIPSGKIRGSKILDPTRIVELHKLIEEMEDHFNLRLERGQDGAPWLWLKYHKPTDWNWTMVGVVFIVRLHRMKRKCNRDHETIDNVETLLLEAVYQCLKFRGKDAFLGLEMTIFAFHPLRFSVGHLVHGQQMRTGWTTLRPASLDDYDESLCNIVFETWVSNLAKHNYDAEVYPHILEDIASISLETEFYKVPESVTPVNVPSMLRAPLRSDGLPQEGEGMFYSEDELEGVDVGDDADADADV